MGYKCYICKIGYTLDSNISLHKFPKDENLKKLWLDACSIKSHLPSHRICNKHFEKSCFNESGYLSKTAVPFLIQGTSVNEPYIREGRCKRKLSYNITPSENDIKNDEFPKNLNKSNQILPLNIIHNPTTITSPTSLNKKIKMYPRYINDLSVDNFTSPRRTQRNLSFLKKKYNEKLKKIHNLQKKNKRLITKVKTLEDLMKVLEAKCLISENASKLLQV